jgi:hypothetical protein
MSVVFLNRYVVHLVSQQQFRASVQTFVRGQVVHVQVMSLNVKVLAVRLGNKLPPVGGTQDSDIALQQPPITRWGKIASLNGEVKTEATYVSNVSITQII